MNRRRLLVLVNTAVGTSLAGCFGQIAQTSDSPPEDREFPEQPETMTGETALEFVKAYEEAWMHNRWVTEDHIEFTVGCPGAIDVEEDGGFYIFVKCRAGSKIEDDDGTISEGTFGPRSRFYFVSDDHTLRIDDRRDESGPSYGSGSGGRELQGFQLVNFNEDDHTVEIDITNRDGNHPVLETEYQIESESFITRTGVTANEGVYDLRVTLETGYTATYEWEITDIVPVYGVNIYITRSGEIRFGTNTEPDRPDYFIAR